MLLNYSKGKRRKLFCCLSALFLSISACADSGFEEAYQSFDVSAIKADVKTLSSDKFAGREPSTPGETLTTKMLVSRFKKLGLAPGNGDSYLQAVPMNSIVSLPVGELNICLLYTSPSPRD